MEDKVPIIGISRHRIGVDGQGVTTLVAFHGCPLSCQYCLNPSCSGPTDGLMHLSPKELYLRVGIDNLYFLATQGGICFGGGEPLMRMDFIHQFRLLCGHGWMLTAETSLHVPSHIIDSAASVIDHFIVDIKDTNPSIYRNYTHKDNTLTINNLRHLLKLVGPDRIIVRVPSIPNYNTPQDIDRSIDLLHHMGITQIDQFEYIVRKISEQ